MIAGLKSAVVIYEALTHSEVMCAEFSMHVRSVERCKW
jgi:hypothetical protein